MSPRRQKSSSLGCFRRMRLHDSQSPRSSATSLTTPSSFDRHTPAFKAAAQHPEWLLDTDRKPSEFPSRHPAECAPCVSRLQVTGHAWCADAITSLRESLPAQEATKRPSATERGERASRVPRDPSELGRLNGLCWACQLQPLHNMLYHCMCVGGWVLLSSGIRMVPHSIQALLTGLRLHPATRRGLNTQP